MSRIHKRMRYYLTLKHTTPDDVKNKEGDAFCRFLTSKHRSTSDNESLFYDKEFLRGLTGCPIPDRIVDIGKFFETMQEIDIVIE